MVGKTDDPAVWPRRIYQAGCPFPAICVTDKAEARRHLPGFGLRSRTKTFDKRLLQRCIRFGKRDSGRCWRCASYAVVGHHRLGPRSIPLQTVGNVHGAGHHALPPHPLKIVAAGLFRHQQRNDRRDRHAQRQDDENLPGHGPEKAANPAAQPRYHE